MGQVVCLSLFFFVLSGTERGLGAQQTLDYIYIDSSVDEAAGGHAALRFDETVFHYQYYDEGYFLLVKDTWDEFRYQYNDLQNRTLVIASLPLSSDTYQKIKTRFLSRYLLQEKRFSYLEQLEAENDFLQAFSKGVATVPVKGLGFFSPDQKNDLLALSLKELIDKQLGGDYLENVRKKVALQLLRAEENIQPLLFKSEKLNLYSSTLSFFSPIYNYFELQALYEAVSVLADARPVLRQTLLQSGTDVGLLNADELEKLKQFQERIIVSILHLLESSRPGKGTALLVQTARFQALALSIKNGCLITLDPFSEEADLIPVENLLAANLTRPNNFTDSSGENTLSPGIPFMQSRTYFEQLRYERFNTAWTARKNFFCLVENKDISFNQLESSLARFWEIDQADKLRKMIRVEGGNLVPGRSRIVQKALHGEGRKDLLLEKLSEKNIILFKNRLLEIYDYNLFDKNCVTELFRTIYSSFSTIEQAQEELGGYLEPGKNFSFIPFQSFNMVEKSFSVGSVEVLPSFRKRQVDDLYRVKGVWTLLEESNTLTSSVYFSWEKDSIFLLFTDDIFLFRPVFGVVNFVYAAIHTISGIVWLPVDQGMLLRRSFRGMVFSLPELGFFSIRKGTFPAVSY